VTFSTLFSSFSPSQTEVTVLLLPLVFLQENIQSHSCKKEGFFHYSALLTYLIPHNLYCPSFNSLFILAPLCITHSFFCAGTPDIANRMSTIG